MPRTFYSKSKKSGTASFWRLWQPLVKILAFAPVLHSKSNRPLQMTFEDQLKALVLFHLDEHTSGRHLLQVLKQDDYARKHIAPEKGIEKSAFFEALSFRGLERFQYVFNQLQQNAQLVLPNNYEHFGSLVAIDGSLIDAVLSMTWADYRKESKKARVHVGFDLNHGIPIKVYLTDGKTDERKFALKIIAPDQTGVLDRGYQCHKNFDQWQGESKFFVCRIQDKTNKTILKSYDVTPDSIIFYDKLVLLGVKGKNQSEKPVRLVGYKIDGATYWIATNRFDLKAEQIAEIYKLRWQIEIFFGWWKQHLKVYPLISRSKHGLMVQILSGLITYMLLAIYCHEQHQEKVSIARVRELRIKIQNETRNLNPDENADDVKEHLNYHKYAKT
jgi:hypothetical protein